MLSRKRKTRKDSIEELSEYLKYNKPFHKGVERLRYKFGIPSGGFQASNKFSAWVRNLSIDNEKQLWLALIKLVRSSDLNPAFEFDFLWFYVVMSDNLLKSEGLLPKEKPRVSLEINGLNKRLVVYNIHPFTTEAEWTQLWPKVKEMREMMFSVKWTKQKRRNREMFNKDIAEYIAREREKDLPFKDIYEQAKKKFGKSRVSSEQDTSKQLQRLLRKARRDT